MPIAYVGSKTGLLTRGQDLKDYSLQLEFPEVSYFTVQFNIPQPPVDGVYEPNAVILMSVGGTDIKRKIAIGTGTSFSGVAEVVKISCNDRTILSDYGLVDATPVRYRLDTVIGPGVRPSKILPCYVGNMVIQHIDIAAGATDKTNLGLDDSSGKNLCRVRVWCATAPVLPGDVTVYQEMGVGILLTAHYLDPVVFPDWFPLFPPTRKIVIVNNSAKVLKASITTGVEG